MILAETLAGYNGGFIPLIWGGAVSIMIYAVGHISGAHFNPWLNKLLLAIDQKNFQEKGFSRYVSAQIGGAIFASLTHGLIFGFGHKFGNDCT